MLGKIHPLVLGPVGLVLIIGVGIGGFMFLVKPLQEQITTKQGQIEQEKATAGQRQQAEKDREEVKREWERAHDGLAQIMDERSIPLSMGHPMIATMNLWREVREDLPQLIERFVEQSGCVLVQGHPGWQVPMSPLPPTTEWIRLNCGGSATGGTEIAANGNSPLVIAGTMADIERLYKSLRTFPRVLTIEHLAVMPLRETAGTQLHQTVQQLLDRPDDDIMVGLLFLNVWLMCEAQEGAGGGGAAAGGAAGPGGAPGGMGGAPGGAPGGMGGPPGAGAPGGASGPPGGAPGGGPPAPPGGGGGGGGGDE